MCKSSYIVQIFGDDLTYLDVNKKASLNTCVQNTPHIFWAIATRDNPYSHLNYEWAYLKTKRLQLKVRREVSTQAFG